MRKFKKRLGFIVLLFGAGAVAFVFAAAIPIDAQVLDNSHLSFLVGAACCKSATPVNANCRRCQQPDPKDGTSFECTAGDEYTKRVCKSGTPDGCDPDGSAVKCSVSTKVFELNEDCDGLARVKQQDCNVPSARGDVCD